MKRCDSAPLLSVIVPVYNVEEFVRECLLSVLGQDYGNMEIVVVNDGSTDESARIVREIARQYDSVIVYDKPNGGLSDARNFGLDRARGKFLTFIDSDDVLLRTDIYSRIMSLFAADETLDVVQYDVVHKWRSAEEHRRTYPFQEYAGPGAIAEGYLREWIHVSCCDKVFRASCFGDVRFPLRQISEDIAIIPQLLGRVRKLRTADIGCYGYRYREGSITTAVPVPGKIFSILGSYFKYHSFTFGFEELRPLTVMRHVTLIWSYSSLLRKHHPEVLPEFYAQHFFLRLNVRDWLACVGRPRSVSFLIKSFITCVLGPKYVVGFQHLFTR